MGDLRSELLGRLNKVIIVDASLGGDGLPIFLIGKIAIDDGKDRNLTRGHGLSVLPRLAAGLGLSPRGT